MKLIVLNLFQLLLSSSIFNYKTIIIISLKEINMLLLKTGFAMRSVTYDLFMRSGARRRRVES